MAKQNVSYGDSQKAGIKGLVDKSSFEKGTAHVTFDPTSVQLPEGVTAESMSKHINALNDLTGQVGGATAEIARREYEANKKIERVDGTLEWGGVTINSDHDLRQKVGDDYIYGSTVTTTIHDYSPEQTSWLEENLAHNASLAKDLFD